MENETAYLKINDFGGSKQLNIEEIVKKYQQNRTLKNTVIDLRNNLGGNLYSTVDLANEFLEAGIIAQEIDKYENIIHKADGKGRLKNLQVIILADKDISSAAELFAAALWENNRAKIIGQKTYGKGTLQDNFIFADGGVLHLTVGKWLTPKGNFVEDRGLEPDIKRDDLSTNLTELHKQLLDYFSL